jgi:hypothetical protein
LKNSSSTATGKDLFPSLLSLYEKDTNYERLLSSAAVKACSVRTDYVLDHTRFEERERDHINNHTNIPPIRLQKEQVQGKIHAQHLALEEP